MAMQMGSHAKPLKSQMNTADAMNNRQQIMLRQRQLALQRQRERVKHHSYGPVTQQEQPMLTSALQSKAPGWGRLIEIGVDSAGSLAEKQHSTTKVRVVVLDGTDGTSENVVSGNAENLGAAAPTPAEQVATIANDVTTTVGNTARDSDCISELGLSGPIDLKSASEAPAENAAPANVLAPTETVSQAPVQSDRGWDLHFQTDDVAAAPEKNGTRKLWRPWKSSRTQMKPGTIAEDSSATRVSEVGDIEEFNASGSFGDLRGAASRTNTPWPETALEAGLPGCLPDENLADGAQRAFPLGSASQDFTASQAMKPKTSTSLDLVEDIE
eukprot:CAMPEP_0117557068 /NCGR_PEP_ID=MMETSP0784-20121206/52135_1 /TAXON_ID=39447 /ORGANISM="" /LENGTH=326 /DNA_ID=CAMNT_0005354365 /DNA_START=26 /DNA_END=1006 /DNA_ORIENTATION=+